MLEWSLAVPYLEAAGIVVALVLGVANLAWLIVQARRSRETHAIALEAHGWERERREEEQRQARERREAEQQQKSMEAARLAFWQRTREQVDKAAQPIDIPEGTPSEWVVEGEALGYFRRMRHPAGHIVLFRAAV